MKKIFAIALALVMVLSMASAFASECNVGPYDWSCATKATKCGKATVEVIPLVKANDACADWKMMDSTCAAAVTSDDVYYAIKLTIPKDIDPEWYAKANLTLTCKGVDKTVAGEDGVWELKEVYLKNFVPALTGDESEDGWVYYIKVVNGNFATVGGEQTEAIDKAEYKDVYNTMAVGNAAKAKVCVTLKSENKFESAKVGDYTVTWLDNPTADDGKWNNGLSFKNKDNQEVMLYTDKDDKVQKIVVNGILATSCTTEAALINDVLAKYNLGCGYGMCITYDAVKANFGWKDKVESCFSWSDKAPSIVDAECVVAIPKTGDKGLLWWLF